MAPSTPAHARCKLRGDLDNCAFQQSDRIFDCSHSDKIPGMADWICTLPDFAWYGIFWLRRGIRKHVVLSSPGDFEPAECPPNSRRGTCSRNSRWNNGKFLKHSEIYGLAFSPRRNCRCTHRNPPRSASPDKFGSTLFRYCRRFLGNSCDCAP